MVPLFLWSLCASRFVAWGVLALPTPRAHKCALVKILEKGGIPMDTIQDLPQE